MSSKSWLLIIIFMINIIATAMADSEHIEVETHDAQKSHIVGKENKKASNKANSDMEKADEEHCEEHEDCHNGHFHHYIIFGFKTVCVSSLCTQESFNNITSLYSSTTPEIIKPPLV